MNFALVFIGGGLGAIIRWAFGMLPIFKSVSLLTGTLVANGLAALILGACFRLFSNNPNAFSQNAWLLLAVGFCGGLSTFSTFSLELFKMFQEQRWIMALGYIGLNVGVSLILLIFAYQIAEGWKG